MLIGVTVPPLSLPPFLTVTRTDDVFISTCTAALSSIPGTDCRSRALTPSLVGLLRTPACPELTHPMA